jgi:hypothetical protein
MLNSITTPTTRRWPVRRVFRTFAALIACVVSVLTLGGCIKLDGDRYATGDPGEAKFINILDETVYLGGCSAFNFEIFNFEDIRWEARESPVYCFWEGFAQPIEPGRSRIDPFDAPLVPGYWRLNYPVGFGCAEDQPLAKEYCKLVKAIASQPFRVLELCEPRECGPRMGMPNILCPDGESIAGPTGRCLRSLETDLCGWEIASCPEEH